MRRLRQRGSILILSLLTLSTLAIMATGVSRGVYQQTHVLQHLETREEARLFARAGVHNLIGKMTDMPFTAQTHLIGWVRKHPMKDGYFLVGYPDEQMMLSDGDRGYVMMDENRKININFARPETLKRLLLHVTELTDDKADRLAYAIVDYRDADDDEKKYLVSGSEKHDYQLSGLAHGPKNAFFELVSELLLVRGMTREVYESLREYVTVYGNGRININTASEISLRSLNVDLPLVRRILALRKGADETIGTADDLIFTNVETIHDDLDRIVEDWPEREQVSLGYALKRQELSVQSTHFAFLSEGGLTTKNVRSRVICIYNVKEGIRYWREI